MSVKLTGDQADELKALVITQNVEGAREFVEDLLTNIGVVPEVEKNA